MNQPERVPDHTVETIARSSYGEARLYGLGIQEYLRFVKLIGEPDMRGRGYAKEATQLWIRYGLSGLNLNKIYLNTLGTNLSNIRLNEELGFKVEGILRNEVIIDGRYHDKLRMGLLRSAVTRPALEPVVQANRGG